MSSPDGTPLPSPRQVLTSLISSLNHLHAPSTSNNPTHSTNPLAELPAEARNLFITLHCLFPAELLPALDLLDRRLVTALTRLCNPAAAATNAQPAVYYVRSARGGRRESERERHRAGERQRDRERESESYEVRLTAWNCSCPAFTLSAFTRAFEGVSAGEEAAREEGLEMGREKGKLGSDNGWSFGGLGLGSDEGLSPVCKHLLACVLAEQCPLLQGCVERRVVGKEELAGWAAGWGG